MPTGSWWRSRSGGGRRSSAVSWRGAGHVRPGWRWVGRAGPSGSGARRPRGRAGIPAASGRAAAWCSRRGHGGPAIARRGRRCGTAAGQRRYRRPGLQRGPFRGRCSRRGSFHRDMVDNQQEHAPRLDVQPVGHRPGLAGPGRRRRGVHPAARAPHRVLVVLRHRRGDHRGVDDLVRRRHPEILRPGKIPAARARAPREQRLRHPAAPLPDTAARPLVREREPAGGLPSRPLVILPGGDLSQTRLLSDLACGTLCDP